MVGLPTTLLIVGNLWSVRNSLTYDPPILNRINTREPCSRIHLAKMAGEWTLDAIGISGIVEVINFILVKSSNRIVMVWVGDNGGTALPPSD